MASKGAPNSRHQPQPFLAQCGSLRLVRVALLLCTIVRAAADSPDVNTAADMTALLVALDGVKSEAQATELVTPHTESLAKLDQRVLEKVVLRQWWSLARDIVAKSHAQSIDFSFIVRNAVRTVKDESDELLRTLNPKYGIAHEVLPAFQWAQNDTSLFLMIKYTVRWNAPGALEVTEPLVVFGNNTFEFTGLGKHSNNKYKYALKLNFFDNVDIEASTWSTGSVGKLSVIVRKLWPRKWPRLLGDKKTKITNMHVWMEKQDQLDKALTGITAVSNSPVTCKSLSKLYCLATDTCKFAENCTQCPGKTVPNEDLSLCSGMPTTKPNANFRDTDLDEGEIGGLIKITKGKNEFDLTRYVLYYGKDSTEKLVLMGEVAPSGISDTEFRIASNTKIPEGATHILVYAANDYGEYIVPGVADIRDVALPKHKPGDITFDDEDGKVGDVSGIIMVGRASNETLIDEYGVHWGKSPTRRISSSSFIMNIPVPKGESPMRREASVTHFISRATKIPDSASHFLVYAKNSQGEHPHPSSIPIRDGTYPCLHNNDPDCPKSVRLERAESESGYMEGTVHIERAQDESNLQDYVVYWSKDSCSVPDYQAADWAGLLSTLASKKLSVIRTVGVEKEPLNVVILKTPIPTGATHIIVISKNRFGESAHCTSERFAPEVVVPDVPEVVEMSAESGPGPEADAMKQEL